MGRRSGLSSKRRGPLLGLGLNRRAPARNVENLDRWPAGIQAIFDNEGMVVEKKKAAGHRRGRAYLGKMHEHAEKAQDAADSRFGGHH